MGLSGDGSAPVTSMGEVPVKGSGLKQFADIVYRSAVETIKI